MIKDKNKYSQVSYTYVPNLGPSFNFHPVENDTRNISIKVSKIKNSTESNKLKPNFDNGWRRNKSYKELLNQSGQLELDNISIINSLSTWIT